MNRQRLSKRPLPPRKLPSACLCCGGSDPWVVNKVDFIVPFRDAEHSVHAEVNQCRHCDAISTTEEQSAAISAQIRDAHRKWISERLKKAQKELGLSLRELSDKTGISFATLGRVSSGDHLIEATMEKLLWVQIEKLTHEHRSSVWIQTENHELRVTNGSVLIKADSKNLRVYARVLKTAAQTALGNRCDSRQAKRLSDQSCGDLVLA